MRRLRIVCMVIAGACLSAAFCPNYERTVQAYHFPLWRGLARESYARILPSFNVPDNVIQTNNDPSVRALVKNRARYWRVIVEANGGGQELFRIERFVATNVVAAQEQLVNCMAGFPVGDYSSATNDIGDRGYGVVMRYQNLVAFSRNNIFICVSSLTNSFSSESIARQIDADILQKSMQDH